MNTFRFGLVVRQGRFDGWDSRLLAREMRHAVGQSFQDNRLGQVRFGSAVEFVFAGLLVAWCTGPAIGREAQSSFFSTGNPSSVVSPGPNGSTTDRTFVGEESLFSAAHFGGKTIPSAGFPQQPFAQELPEQVSTDPPLVVLPDRGVPEPAADASPAWHRLFVRTTFDVRLILAEPGVDSIEMTDVNLSTSLALPWSTPENAWVVTPGFFIHFWEGPTSVDLPETLYDTWVDLTWRAKWSPRLRSNIGVAVGVYSDFEATDSDAIRITGRALVNYQWDSQLELTFGIVYLDRASISLLPVIGLIWTPSDYWRVELVAPRPRIARRVHRHGKSSGWLYLGGEFGGGSWQIERTGGATTIMDYNDYRLLFGYEWQGRGRLRARAELGYVFWREIDLSDAGDLDLDDALMLRAGVTF